jgi:hypothetical protein
MFVMHLKSNSQQSHHPLQDSHEESGLETSREQQPHAKLNGKVWVELIAFLESLMVCTKYQRIYFNLSYSVLTLQSVHLFCHGVPDHSLRTTVDLHSKGNSP